MSRPLGKRLQRFMVHTCDLYRPAAPAAIPGTKRAADFSIQTTPAYTNVLCRLQSTPEFDERQIQGITKQINLLTSDKWSFLEEQEIADTWIIVMRTPDHPDVGKRWSVQGNPTTNASAPGRDTRSQWVFAKISPKAQIPGA